MKAKQRYIVGLEKLAFASSQVLSLVSYLAAHYVVVFYICCLICT